MTELSSWLTGATAVAGAVLGVFNAWRAWSTNRPLVKVKCSHAVGLGLGGHEPAFTIDIVNLSSFPVTVTNVGVHLLGSKRHLALAVPFFTRGEKLPIRLESRAACTVVQPLSALKDEELALLERAYVNTACGLHRKSARSVFRQINGVALARMQRPPGE